LGPLLSNTLGKPQADLSVLDGGCGTGLCAPALKPYATELIGVDLSNAMLDRAKKLKLYDALIESELTSYLQNQSDALDLALFADTFCYFGDLKKVIRATSGALRDKGTIIFSLELLSLKVDSTGYRLHPHGRYSHTKPYVETTLLSYGFSDIKCRNETLRMEIGKEVAGLMVTATINKS